MNALKSQNRDFGKGCSAEGIRGSSSMRRGSFKRKLPRGSLGFEGSQALLGVAVFLVILVSSLLYLFPHSDLPVSTQSDGVLPVSPSTPAEKILHVLSSSGGHPQDPSDSIRPAGSPGPASASAPYSSASTASASATSLSAASQESSASLSATAQVQPDLTQVSLENIGQEDLHQVQISRQGRPLGTLSDLMPGEKKVFAVAGWEKDLEVSALDSSGRMIRASIQYIPSDSDDTSRASSSPASSASQAHPTPSPQPASPPASAAGGDVLTVKSAELSSRSPLLLSLSANISQGRAGDIVGYRCIAQNGGSMELSEIKIHCAGKQSSTKYLPPGKEQILQGVFALENSTILSATVEARDGRGDVYRNNSSLFIPMISPRLHISVSAPPFAHRGEIIPLQILLENRGKDDLADLRIEYSSGEVQEVGLLLAGAARTLSKEIAAAQNMSWSVSASARDSRGDQVYAISRPDIEVLSSSLQIEAQPASISIYPGQPAAVAWILKNTGQERLMNITLEGDGSRRILRELALGQSVKMEAIYSKSSTSWINVTAKGSDSKGYETAAEAGVLVKSVAPAITIKLMPSEIEACPGEEAKTNVLVTNSGDDPLQDVSLKLNGSLYSDLGDIDPGEFRVISAGTAISANCTLNFLAEGRDSLGEWQRDEASLRVKAVVAALKIFAGASPAAVVPGESCRISCTVANTGKVALHSIFVISKALGPLGNIDFLSPKRQMTIASEKTIEDALQDVVTAEGFTEDKRPVRATFNLRIELLDSPSGRGEPEDEPAPGGPQYDLEFCLVNISCGNVSFAFNLPEQEEAQSQVSGTMARDIDSSADRQNEGVLGRIAGFLGYVERLLGLDGGEAEEEADSKSHAARQFFPEGAANSGNYELSIAGVKGSEHGAITILDVNANPTQPAAGEPVKVTVHLQCPQGVRSASVKYGLSDMPLTKRDMLSVDRVYDSPLSLESGDPVDGYWSGTIPGRGPGVYMPLSVWIWDGSSTAEGGPYLIHWSTVSSAGGSQQVAPSSGSGMLFIESTSVKGRGEVAIKDSIRGSTMHFDEKIMGNGSISLETMRSIDRSTSVDNFTEKKDLVFTDGNIKGHQTVESPKFHGGMGASVTERYNLTHVDRSETASVSSSANNTLSFRTDQAFNGTWNIQTKYAKFYKKIKADQQYTGSFQTQKDIKFADAGQR